MTLPGDVLLEGPRGRRLCLELAMELDQDIRTAVFRQGYDLDPGRGISRVVLTAVSPDDAGAPESHAASGTGESGPVPPADRLAAALSTLDSSGVTDARIQLALERSVDSARYWQPPDGEDVLASRPAVRAALLPLAGQVLNAPGTQWWEADRGVEQWAIDWRPAADPAPLPANLRQEVTNWGRHERAEEAKAAQDRPSDPHAPVSGWWWSVPQGLLRTVGRLPAGLNLVEDSLGWVEATAIPVRGAGRTVEIRTPEDWTELCRRFPLEVTASRRHDWFNTTGRNGRWVIPDWELVAAEWDAVHLTVMGYLRGAGRALPVGAHAATVIAGWEPGSTLWLTDGAREREGPRQAWRRDGQGERWLRMG
jgi:hypothetical protein